MTNVAVFGANGRMGAEICKAVQQAEGLKLVAALDISDDLATARQAEVVVDFTHPSAVMDHIKWCIDNDKHMVVGTTGFTDERIEQVKTWLQAKPELGIIIASNFSIGAVLMMHFSSIASRFFESAEIIELHHPGKVDAPSGTATATARRIAKARAEAGKGAMPDATQMDPTGARGGEVEGVHVHSVRLPGLFAHQEVVFGNPGEMLTIRDDGFDRVSYMPGVIAAVRAVKDHPGYTRGIASLLGLES